MSNVGLGYQSRRTFKLYTAEWVPEGNDGYYKNPVYTGIHGSCWNCTEDSKTLTYDASSLTTCSIVAKIIDEHWVWINGSEISQVMLKSINMHISKNSIAGAYTLLQTVKQYDEEENTLKVLPHQVKVYGYVHNENITLPETVSYTKQVFESSPIIITSWDNNLSIDPDDNILGKPFTLDQKYKAFIVKVVFELWLNMYVPDAQDCVWKDPRYGIACTSYAEGWLGVYDPSTLIIAGGGGELIVQP